MERKILMLNFNKEQKKAVIYPAKPLLILAGAGTGKTTTIVGRMAHLIQDKKAIPESILVLTFTNDAAKNMKIKLANEIGSKGDEIHAYTFHAFAKLQTMKYFNILGYRKAPEVMNKGDIYFLIRKRFDDLGRLRSKIFRRNPISAIQSFQKVFEAFRYNLLDYQELQKLEKIELNKISNISDEKIIEQSSQLVDMVNVFPKYQNWKKEQNRIDYGDMIFNLWELIKDHPDAIKELKKNYKHVIVDEFQDNNYALSRIVEKIAEPENSITVVGDDNQCIYAFRQANIQNIYRFIARYYTNSNAPISLNRNYRSSQPILDLANSIIIKNIERMTKGELISEIKDRNKPKLYIGSEKMQLKQILKILTQLLETGEYPGNIAILMRSHRKCRLVSKFLNINGICTYYHADNLYEQSVIKDVISYLNIWGKTERADHAFIRLIRKIIDEDMLISLTNEYSNDKSKISFIKYTLSKKNKIGAIAREIIKSIVHINVLDANDLVWKLLKIGKIYRNTKMESYGTKKEWHALNRFREIVAVYCQTYQENNISEFIDFINIQKEVNDEPLSPLNGLDDIPAIRIMTVHASKGMEFKHVLIPFLRSGIFPHRYESKTIIDRLPISWQRWDVGDKEEKELHYEEERRLLYVAITRAIETVTLFAPSKYQSPFIKNINNQLVIIEDIMKTEDSLNIYDKQLGKYQVQLKVEIGLRNFKKAKELLGTIQNIVQLSNGIEPLWNNNSMKREVMDSLSQKDDHLKIKHLSLSSTSINVYHECPLKYKYIYVDHIPGATKKPYLQLGKIIHKVLELFHKNKKTSFKELMDLLDNNWQDDYYQYKEEKKQNREDAEMMLKNYWNYIQLNPVNAIYTEHEFSFDMQYAKLTGKCDRIDLDNEKNVFIVDYKTSKRTKTEGELKKNIQLGIYAIFLLHNGIEWEGDTIQTLPQKLTMLFLRDVDPEVSIVFSAEDIAIFKKDIEEVSGNIQKGIYEPCKGIYCDWCDYKEFLCPLFG